MNRISSIIKNIAILSFSLVITASSLFAQDELCWNDRKLTWDDFGAAPDPRFNQPGMQAAITDAVIRYSKSETTGEFIVNTVFNKKGSWMVGNKTATGLAHEQLHFDLAEAYARKIRAYVKENQGKSEQKILSGIKKLMKEHDEMQQEYDADVQMRGLDRAEQQKIWNSKVSKLLKKNKNHRSTQPCSIPELPAGERKNVITQIAKLVRENFVVTDIANKTADGILAYQKEGKYSTIDNYDDLTRIVTQDLRALSDDLHLYLRQVDTSPQGMQSASGPQIRRMGSPNSGSNNGNVRTMTRQAGSATQGQQSSGGSPQIRRIASPGGESFDRFRNEKGQLIAHEILDGNVLYINVPVFAPLSVIESELKAALESSLKADAIIVDVRNCPGGMGDGMEYLAGGLFAEPTFLSKHVGKDGGFESYSAKTPYGKANADKPVYVLTSQRSFSAAEAFAFFLQETGRIETVGDQTLGGGRTVESHPVNDRLNIAISSTIATSSKGNEFQGVGVRPDYPIDEKEALTKAHTLALKKISTTKNDPNLSKLAEKIEKEAKKEKAALGDMVGKYGIRSIALNGGKLAYKKEGQPDLGMKKIGKDLYELVLPAGVRSNGKLSDIRFDRDKEGKIVSFSLIKNNSVIDTFPKEN